MLVKVFGCMVCKLYQLTGKLSEKPAYTFKLFELLIPNTTCSVHNRTPLLNFLTPLLLGS